MPQKCSSTLYRFLIITWGILGLINTNNAFSQEFIYRNKLLNIFPNNFNREINCITTDDKGFLWAGTNFGLFRYDGYNTDPLIFYNKDSLNLSPEIYDACFGNKNLYLATSNGVYVVETNKEEYNAYPISNALKEPVICVYSDNESGVWWVSNSGLIGNKKNGQIHWLKIPKNIKYQQVYINSNKNHLYLCFGNNQLISIQKNTKKIDRNITIPQVNAITGISNTTEFGTIIATNKGVFKLNDDENIKLTWLPEFGNDARNILFANNHVFIHRYNSSIEHLYKINNEYKSNTFLINIDNNLDASKLVWYNNQLIIPGRTGIGVFQIKNNHFKQLFETNNSIHGNARGIAEDEENYYLCSYQNIVKYNKKTGESIIISKEPFITHGVLLEKDTLWIASESKGLIRFNLKTNKATFIYNDSNQQNLSLICIKPLNNDSLIIGGYRHLYIYNKANGKLSEITPLNITKQVLSNGYYKQIEVLDAKTLLVASFNGLFKIGIDGHFIKKYSSNNPSNNSDNTNCFWISSKKQIWTGTSDGIIIYDSNGTFLNRIGFQNGLAGNKIAGMLADKLGNLWVGTFSGLSCISISDLEINNYYIDDGLPDNEFNHSSFYTSQDNQLLMGTMRGFIELIPSNVTSEKKIPSGIIISRIERERNGKMEYILNTNEIPTDIIHLGKDIKYTKLYFCRLPIQIFSEINFSYKILKLIPQSVDISDKPVITLTDTEPGKFDVEININNGKGSNGIYNKIFTYQVSEYFYLNKWFYFIIFLFFSLLAIAYLYTLVIQKNKNLTIRKEIARDLHDEIGGSLTAISLYTELLRDDKPPTRKQIDSIQQTTRKLLLSFRDALWTLNTESDNAQQLWDHIKDMVSEITNNLSIHVHFEEATDLQNYKLTLKVKQNLLLAIKEGINNAIKHGDRKNLKLQWIITNDKHAIIITNSINNSESFNKFTISNGIGLDSMKNRMNNIGGSLSYSIIGENFVLQYHLNFLS